MRFGVRGANNETLPFFDWIAYSKEDSGRWIVWLGRYTLDSETRVPNVLLRRVRNPLERVKDKCRTDCVSKSVERRGESRA